MRVAIVNEHVGAWRGGAETSTREMAQALRGLGVDVTLIMSTPAARNRHSERESRHSEPFDQAQSRLREESGSDGALTVVTCGSAAGSRAARTRSFVSVAAELCRNERFDVVHAVTPIRGADIYQPRGGTYVETIERSVGRAGGPWSRGLRRLGRRLNVRQQFLLATERELLSGPHPPFVAAVSDYVRRQVLAAYGVPQERVRVVFNGVNVRPLPPDEAERQRRGLRARLHVGDAPLVLFVAHNFKLKGLAELIRAAAAVAGGARLDELGGRQAEWVLCVAGRDGPEPYERLGRRLGVADRLHFVGADVPVVSLYAAADVLAHPTWYDPCSRVVLEALCCGLPVVTTRFNGAAEALEPGRHGAVVDAPDDAAALAEAIRAALRPEIRRMCLADAGRLREQLSMERHARELLALYRDVTR